MNSSTYQGEELTLFASAQHWKAYWSDRVRPFLGRDVLEVGAGMGANTSHLAAGHTGRWVCLEPDASLAAEIPDQQASGEDTQAPEVRVGCLVDLHDDEQFDSILYIDVLEHIEDDARELSSARRHLRPGGTLIVLAPAIPALFSPFDTALGHFRRYTAERLRKVGPPGATLESSIYLDVAGIVASLGNRFLLRRRTPAPWQIRLWDRSLVRISRRLDPLLGFRLGKSILTVWRAAG